MDLATVKARVKAWEKSFRGEHKREPTKDDIKNDGGDIANLYALYRKLSKTQTKDKSSKTSSSASTSTSASQTARTTPRRAPQANGPATPTPPARRRSSQAVSVASAASFAQALDESPEAGPSRPQPKSSSGPPSTPQKRQSALLTLTPKRREGYNGPVQDPLPNPFSATPRKNAHTIAFESPFIHASSPRKLKDVLEANSLRATRERAAVENTPRTRARKRLAGEEVENTPAKAPRRRRGDRPGKSGILPGAAPIEEATDEEIDETPAKPGSAAFALVDDRGRGMNDRGDGKGADLFPIFQRAKRAAENGQNGRAKRQAVERVTIPAEEDEEEEGPGSPSPPSAILPDSGTRSVSETSRAQSEILPQSPPPVSRTRTSRPKAHVLTLSDDEWDPEADARTVMIVGTRREAVKVQPDAGVASDEEMESGVAEDDGDDDDEFEAEEEEEEIVVNGTTTTPLLSYLSLRSPIARAGERLADLRVRALLDPTSAAAAALRAATRGQDVFVCGEVDGEGDEWEVNLEADVEGDDDWESDAEGWKAERVEEDW